MDDMELRLDEEKNIAYIRLSGLLSEKAILNAFDVAVSSKKYKKGMGRLWDFRDANLSSLDYSTIESMSRYPMKFPAGICDVKVAFVTSRPLEYGLARMFEAFSWEGKTKISVFYKIDEAEIWLMEKEGKLR